MRLIALCAAAAAAAHGPPVPSEVWPMPAQFSHGSTPLPLSPALTLSCAGLCPEPLPLALTRYASVVFFASAPLPPSGPALASLVVTVARDAPLSPRDAITDEAYNLTVPADGTAATLQAATQWGALRGLESFAQLCIWAGPDDATNAYVITNTPVAISDAPRFAIRGLLIDTSFNFLTVSRILEVLDSAAIMKSNVLHWHALDDPAWPMETSAFPNFTVDGPYASVAVYSVADQTAIAKYAWERGVAILFEFDVPGHSAAWGAGNPDLVVACDGHQTLINPVGDVSDPSSFYGVLGVLLTEFRTRAGAASAGLPMVHLGGDEVTDYFCWQQSAAVKAWAASLGISPDPLSIRAAFTTRVQEVAAAAGVTPLFWEEAFTEGNFDVHQSSIITPWVHPHVVGDAVTAGHDVLVYVGYYLDQWVPPARTDADWYSATVSYGFIDSWRLLYTFDPVLNTGVAPVNASRVLGGVASAWGDNVDSSMGATGLLYPRALAVGERLWSPLSITNVSGPPDDALDVTAARLEHARCKLAQRGIGASPVGIAGTYGFCWSPAWGSASPSPSPSTDAITVSSGALAGIIIMSAIIGGVAALAYAYRTTLWAAFAGSTPFPSPSKQLSPQTSSARVVALDQLRGLTIVAMLFVNLYYGRSGLPHFFSHGITYMSGPDLVEPCFHFCVGFALRLVLLKRLASTAQSDWWAARGTLFMRTLQTRVFGLILVSMFFTEGWGSFDSWAALTGFRDWLTQLVQNVQPYHTLTHIAFFTVWTFLPMTMGWRIRLAQLVATATIHTLLHATFYFRWIKTYGLDEGGYFGFTGWAIEALVGSLAHDLVCTWVHEGGVQLEVGGGDGAVPLLRTSSLNDTASVGGGHTSSAHARKRLVHATWGLVGSGGVLMALAYLLSCLGAHPSLNPVCYDGKRIYFWGGFGDEAPCTGVPTWGGGLLVAPPFAVPDVTTNVVTMWTMTQRAGSTTYHLFTAGTSLILLAAMLCLCELGVSAPTWWRGTIATRAARFLGVHVLEGGGGKASSVTWEEGGEDDEDEAVLLGEERPHRRRRTLLLRWETLDVFGENALAVYIMGDQIGDAVGNMLPDDCPAWYFLCWGETLYLGVTYICASYLRAHKLFLRL